MLYSSASAIRQRNIAFYNREAAVMRALPRNMLADYNLLKKRIANRIVKRALITWIHRRRWNPFVSESTTLGVSIINDSFKPDESPLDVTLLTNNSFSSDIDLHQFESIENTNPYESAVDLESRLNTIYDLMLARGFEKYRSNGLGVANSGTKRTDSVSSQTNANLLERLRLLEVDVEKLYSRNMPSTSVADKMASHKRVLNLISRIHSLVTSLHNPETLEELFQRIIGSVNFNSTLETPLPHRKGEKVPDRAPHFVVSALNTLEFPSGMSEQAVENVISSHKATLSAMDPERVWYSVFNPSTGEHVDIRDVKLESPWPFEQSSSSNQSLRHLPTKLTPQETFYFAPSLESESDADHMAKEGFEMMRMEAQGELLSLLDGGSVQGVRKFLARVKGATAIAPETPSKYCFTRPGYGDMTKAAPVDSQKASDWWMAWLSSPLSLYASTAPNEELKKDEFSFPPTEFTQSRYHGRFDFSVATAQALLNVGDPWSTSVSMTGSSLESNSTNVGAAKLPSYESPMGLYGELNGLLSIQGPSFSSPADGDSLNKVEKNVQVRQQQLLASSVRRIVGEAPSQPAAFAVHSTSINDRVSEALSILEKHHIFEKHLESDNPEKKRKRLSNRHQNSVLLSLDPSIARSIAARRIQRVWRSYQHLNSLADRYHEKVALLRNTEPADDFHTPPVPSSGLSSLYANDSSSVMRRSIRGDVTGRNRSKEGAPEPVRRALKGLIAALSEWTEGTADESFESNTNDYDGRNLSKNRGSTSDFHSSNLNQLINSLALPSSSNSSRSASPARLNDSMNRGRALTPGATLRSSSRDSYMRYDGLDDLNATASSIPTSFYEPNQHRIHSSSPYGNENDYSRIGVRMNAAPPSRAGRFPPSLSSAPVFATVPMPSTPSSGPFAHPVSQQQNLPSRSTLIRPPSYPLNPGYLNHPSSSRRTK